MWMGGQGGAGTARMEWCLFCVLQAGHSPLLSGGGGGLEWQLRLLRLTPPPTHPGQKILLPSVVHLEERLAVSQSVSQASSQLDSQLGKQAGRQFGFFSGRLGFKQWGEQLLLEVTAIEWLCSRLQTCSSVVLIPVLSALPTLTLVQTLLGTNSIAFGKSTSQRIYPKQHTPKIGLKLHKYGLKHALHILDGHFR